MDKIGRPFIFEDWSFSGDIYGEQTRATVTKKDQKQINTSDSIDG